MSNRSQQVANRKITMAAKRDAKGAPCEGDGIRRDRNGLTRCRVCGCTEVNACYPPCGWQPGERDICTGCYEASRALEHWLHSARRANKAALWREVESIVPF